MVRDSSVVERWIHNPQVASSILAPAPKFAGLQPTETKMNYKRLLTFGLLALALAVSCFAQNPSGWAGDYNALNFAYGVTASAPPLTVVTGSAAGAHSITVDFGQVGLGDGRVIQPFAVGTYVTIGSGATYERTALSAVTCSTPAIYASCSITATWTYAHGQGERVSSGSLGLQEAMNYAAAQGGGTVAVDTAWTKAGGITSYITNASYPSSATVFVTIKDNRNGTPVYYSKFNAAPGSQRVITADIKTYAGAMTSGTLVAVRGAVTIPTGGSVASGVYLYGTQGKAITGTGTFAGTSLAGLYGQLDVTGGTISAGHVAAVQANIYGANSGTIPMEGIYIEHAGGAVINSFIQTFGKTTYVFDFSSNSHNQMSTSCTPSAVTGTTGGLKVLVDGVVRWIPLAATCT